MTNEYRQWAHRRTAECGITHRSDGSLHRTASLATRMRIEVHACCFLLPLSRFFVFTHSYEKNKCDTAATSFSLLVRMCDTFHILHARRNCICLCSRAVDAVCICVCVCLRVSSLFPFACVCWHYLWTCFLVACSFTSASSFFPHLFFIRFALPSFPLFLSRPLLRPLLLFLFPFLSPLFSPLLPSHLSVRPLSAFSRKKKCLW